MVTALTGILAMFKDAGLSMATVQQDTVTHEQVSALFWVNVALALALMLALAALAPLVAWFYGEPRLLSITLFVAGLFIFDGLAVQHQALMRRQMRFGSLARIQIISTSLALVAAIASAIMGIGYWALLVQLAVSQLSGTFLSWGYCRWIPGRPKRAAGSRSMLKFGGYLTGFNFVNYFARNADNILIGKVWGSGELGLYSKAYNLLLFPLQQINGPISAVATPVLCRLQNDPDGFRDFFRKTLSAITFLTFPLIAWMIICRRDIVLLALGPQWEPAVPIFGALAISAFFQPLGNITGVLYVALGRTRRMLKWGLMSGLWLVFSIIVGLPFGAIGVALAYSAAIALMIIPLILYATSGTFLHIRDFYVAIKYPFFSTALITVVGVLVQLCFTENAGSWLRLGVTTISMFSAYALTSRKLNPQLLRQSLTILFKQELVTHNMDNAKLHRKASLMRRLARFLKTHQKQQTFNSASYWDSRYVSGGTSGAGSYGHLAEFKANVLNTFVANRNIKLVIEFGFGDGNQLILV